MNFEVSKVKIEFTIEEVSEVKKDFGSMINELNDAIAALGGNTTFPEILNRYPSASKLLNQFTKIPEDGLPF